MIGGLTLDHCRTLPSERITEAKFVQAINVPNNPENDENAKVM
jgi:hypothetical protein